MEQRSSNGINKVNRTLCDAYPFLIPRDYSGWLMTTHKDWDYGYTNLDEMPEGWRIAFGDIFVEEVADKARELGILEELTSAQVKEKFGELRWYFDGYIPEIEDINRKYSALSIGICVCCGKPDVRSTRGWVEPICYECWAKVRHGLVNEEMYRAATDDSPMPNEVVWREWDKDKEEWVQYKQNVVGTANKIRARWRTKHAS